MESSACEYDSLNIGPYHIIAPLGRGGMGTVYKARQEPLDRLVAIKLLSASREFPDEQSGIRFKREMCLAAGVSHPNLVKVIDGGTIDGTAYLAMELLEGSSLRDLLCGQRALPWDAAATVALGLAKGLELLHELRILHRDIKPSNVLLGQNNTPKLIDFGLARRIDSTHLTMSGDVVGTLGYLAPEIINQTEATVGSDMWSLGCVLFEMLTGRPAINVSSYQRFVTSLLIEPIPDPRRENPSVPPAVCSLVLQLLQRNEALRLNDAAVVARRLEDILQCARSTPLSPPKTNPDRPIQTLASPFVHTLKIKQLRSFQCRRARRAVMVATGMLVLLVFRGAIAPLLNAVLARRESSTLPRLQAVETKVGCFRSWQKVAALLSLQVDGHLDAKAHRALCDIVEVDLGQDPAIWHHWVNIGHWLYQKQRSPRPPRSSLAWAKLSYRSARVIRLSRDLSRFEVRALLRNFRSESAWVRPHQLRLLLSYTADHPEDGRGWLILGRLLERDGDNERSIILYQLALMSLTSLQMSDCPAPVWTAYARALMRVPGHDLEQEWVPALAGHEAESAVFEGLLTAIDDGARLRALLHRCSEIRALRRGALTALGMVYQNQWEGQRAGELWKSLVKATPNDACAQERLFCWALDTGDLGMARLMLHQDPQNTDRAIRLDFSVGPPERRPTALQRDRVALADEHIVSLEVCRRLELNAVGDARSLAGQFVARRGPGRRVNYPLLLNILGTGSREQEFESRGLRSVFEGVDAMEFAAGALSAPPGQPLMESWFKLDERKYSVTPHRRRLLRALWLSRCGRLEESLSLVTVGLQPYSEKEMTWICEVLSRPIWRAAARGRPLSPQALAAWKFDWVPRARPDDPTNWCSYVQSIQSYWTCLRSGDLRRAAKVSHRLHEMDPSAACWFLTEAWSAACSGDRKTLERTLTELRSGARSINQRVWLLAEFQRLERARKAP